MKFFGIAPFHTSRDWLIFIKYSYLGKNSLLFKMCFDTCLNVALLERLNLKVTL